MEGVSSSLWVSVLPLAPFWENRDNPLLSILGKLLSKYSLVWWEQVAHKQISESLICGYIDDDDTVASPLHCNKQHDCHFPLMKETAQLGKCEATHSFFFFVIWDHCHILPTLISCSDCQTKELFHATLSDGDTYVYVVMIIQR